jgi:tyrosyl-tRNA synthetase
MFERLMSLSSDDLIPKYELLCTDLGPADNARVVAGLADGSIHPNQEKRRMAATVVELYHGPDAATVAQEAFDRIHKQRDLPDDIPELPVPSTVIRAGDDGSPFLYVPALLEALGLVASRSEGGRMLAQGGVRVNGETESRDRIPLEGNDLGAYAGSVWQVGRRRFARVGPVPA